MIRPVKCFFLGNREWFYDDVLDKYLMVDFVGEELSKEEFERLYILENIYKVKFKFAFS